MSDGRVDVDGAVAVVTGAGSGIGRATALALAGRGARVVCADLRGDTAAATAERCGAGASAVEVDVADRSALAALADGAGPVDILVNNAGVGMTGRFSEMADDDWAWIRGINLDGVVNGCAVFGPGMLERGRGHVVNLSSGLGYTPTATEPAYVTTKAAVLALSQCLRADWAGHGVGVTAVCPGVINTPIVDSTRYIGSQDSPEVRRQGAKVFGRGHKPEQVATAILDAIDRDRAIVPVGIEAWAGWFIHRLAPVKAQQALARRSLRR